jgi:flavorubredoxin
VISNHTEMDHSGGLPRIMQAVGPHTPLYCSKLGLKNLARHFEDRWAYHAVEDGESLSLGRRSLTFIETRMLHWPDSMFTYIPDDKILFSSDAFGQHYAGQEKFDDVIGDAIMPHAKKYFANILMLYAPQILKLVEKLQTLGVAFEMICPDHGIIWRRDPGRIIDAYLRWARQTPKKKALVVYDSMWHSTEKMADAIAAGIGTEGVLARPLSLGKWHRSDIMTEVLDAKAIILGSPTLNNGLFPTLSSFITYLKGFRPQHKIGAAFGSFGWSGEAVKLLNQHLEEMKFELVDPGLKIQYVPDRDALAQCFEFGRRIGREVIRRVES